MSSVSTRAGAGVVEACRRTARERPQDLAILDGERRLTYAELERRAAEITQMLRSSGIGRGDRVAVCLDRSAGLVVALFGVLASGAAYVPIDPTYPAERIAWMLEDCRAAALISAPGGADLPTAAPAPGARSRLELTLDRVGLLQAPTATDAHPDPPAGPAARDEDPAYVIYTSGSTGQPKGVIASHAGLANLVDWHLEAFGVDAQNRLSQIASPGFDAAGWEIWPALAAGAALHIVPAGLRQDPVGLRDWLLSQEITVAFVPTALAESLIALDWPETAPLRVLLTGGDALTRRPRPELPFTLVNNYGVSEASVVTTSGTVSADGDGAPSIGAPIRGVEVVLVDSDGNPVPDGAEGELRIGGVSVALGYLNRPELDAERFLSDAHGRWYRSGDLMRRRPDGELEFLGRLDDQLSVRGFRVEPAEVSTALDAHPAVAGSAVIATGASSAERRLIACLVPADHARPEPAELENFVAPRLPEHMRPDGYVWVSELPLTAHGKLDRLALTELALDVAGSQAGGVATDADADPDADPDPYPDQDPIEIAIAQSVAELLGVPSVGPEDNFFLLGGHSLLGAQLIVRLEELYDVEVALRYLFDHPTVREIAAEVRRERAAAGPRS